jgi:hypothetical protein
MITDPGFGGGVRGRADVSRIVRVVPAWRESVTVNDNEATHHGSESMTEAFRNA